MSTATILLGQGPSAAEAKSKLLTELKHYIGNNEWRPQGGITHTIIPPENQSQNTTHLFSVLMIKL